MAGHMCKELAVRSKVATVRYNDLHAKIAQCPELAAAIPKRSRGSQSSKDALPGFRLVD